ncbi:uncharacterized protein KY384_008194 [Bacidia gigantensis]|uniref:uncharacterized protein n=1 Tax=Bacidia gigantensis TaxID=2732470 RepID=UPI001D0453D6|nr:uncharacterized protein KY384_008194 [Bacidia gigantensis]KAG8526765.1 hypothetical protein KY384_008194 [Bacidia gigantensis]
MPRKKPGNQHNNRHENGIVAPGKRITKQKSNGHLNGTAEGGPLTSGVPAPLTSAARATSQERERGVDGETKETPSHTYGHTLQKPSPEKDTAKEGSLSSQLGHANGTAHPSTTKSETAFSKSPTMRKENAFNLAYTIIRSCPLGDTLTILIILLSIPSTILTLINILFAILTFMTPASSFFSLPNTFTDIFQGYGGTPSLATIVITDILGLLIWLVAWTPIQGLALEFAQTVVAATLGGGNTSKKPGYDSTILCFAIVTLRHISNRGWIPSRIFGFDWRAVLSQIPYVPQRPSSFLSFSNDEYFTTDLGWWWWWKWFEVGIALHILIQGLVHGARRWYQKREYFQSASIGKKVDPETGANASSRRTSNTLGDTTQQNSISLSPNTATKTSLPIVREGREKTTSGKKKRKQAAFVRSQQPLWAAFAATKVTIMRECEQKDSMGGVTVPDAKDASDLGDAAFGGVADQVWVSDVLPDSFIFHTTYGLSRDSTYFENDINPPKPLHVRINDTDWTSTKMTRIPEVEGGGTWWHGIVFGLAPSSSYRYSVIQSEGDVVLRSMTVTTSPSPSEETESTNAPSEVPQRSHRPFSPTTPTATLKNSIATFEASFNESCARQKKAKKDNKATSSAIKREIDILNGKISKLVSEDRSHSNRHLQWNQSMKQADEAVVALTDEIEALDRIPDEEQEIFKEKKAQKEAINNQRDALRTALLRAKDSTQRAKVAVQTEAHTAHQKKERLLARRSKLDDQCEKFESTMLEGLNDKERKDSKQALKDLQRANVEQQLHERMATFNQAWHDSRSTLGQYISQARLFENAYHEQQMIANSVHAMQQRPLTPEGDLPGENPQSAAAAAHHLPMFGTPDSAGGLRSHSGSFRQNHDRQRSSSLLSNNSNYVDFEDLEPRPPMPSRAIEAIRGARKQSGGSAGGSSGSSSQRDPASPVVVNNNRDSPVGKKNPVWNQ